MRKGDNCSCELRKMNGPAISYDQYKNAYPKVEYDHGGGKNCGYGWRGNGYGWQLDPAKWETERIYPSVEDPEANEVDATEGVEEEITATKVEKVESIAQQSGRNYLFGEKGSGLHASGDVQDFYRLRDEHTGSGNLFEDPQFPCTDRSLYFSNEKPYGHYYVWKRPWEIVDDPKLFVEGFSRFDVQQGELGDCWLLAAVANLTLHHNLFFQVVPVDQSFDEKYAGIFHFRFWQYGRWIDICIDDRLPTIDGELVFMHSAEKNEFWSALLEKAYAKLHGCYEALKGGSTCEAMEDFTGGIAEMYDLTDAPPDLFKILKTAYERGSLMGCSIEPDPNVLEAVTDNGLVKGHAYSVTRVKSVSVATSRVSGVMHLLRLRNPWGNNVEWNGAWSDQSPEWSLISNYDKENMGLTFDTDGEFWMSFRDFMNHFTRVEICNLNPDSLTDEESSKKWELSYYEGGWVNGVTAGGCRNFLDTFANNPQYNITLTEPDEDDEDGKCTIIVGLMQKNRRQQRDMGLDTLTIGLAIYYLHDPDRVPKPLDRSFFKHNLVVAKTPTFINLREVTCRFTLRPGTYCIIPSTFEPNEEGEFLIRVYSEHKANMEYVGEDGGDQPPTYRPPAPPQRSHYHPGAPPSGRNQFDLSDFGLPNIPFFGSRFNFSFQSPNGQQASAPAPGGNAPYPPNQAPYPTNQAPYPSHNYPPQNSAPYPPQNTAPYPPQPYGGQGYPPQQPYPTQMPAYPQQAPYPNQQYPGYPQYNTRPPYPPGSGGYPGYPPY